LFGKKDIHLHGTVQGICMQFSKNFTVVAYDLSKILLSELKNWSEISQSKMYTNYRHYFTIFVTFYTCYQNAKRKSQKVWKFPVNRLYICKTFAWHLPIKKKLVQAHHRQLVYRVSSIGQRYSYIYDSSLIWKQITVVVIWRFIEVIMKLVSTKWDSILLRQ
jgi:hypothetical protein